MSISVRTAKLQDWRSVANLLVELGRPPVTDDDADAHRSAFATYLSRDDTTAFVALDGDVIGGS